MGVDMDDHDADELDLYSAALAFWDQGFHVIPLGTPAETPPDYYLKRCNGNIQEAKEKWPKTPRVGWRKYQTQAATRDEIEMWWRLWPKANIGLLTGSVIVLDADSKEAVEFIEAGNVTRSPWRVNTSKGAHFYYQRNPSLEIRNSTSKHRIDIRGYGGYVVAPPSVHHAGNVYAWQIDQQYGADSLHDLPILQTNDLQKISSFNNQGKGVELNIDVSNIRPGNHGEPVNVGERNNAAASLAGRYIANKIPIEKVKQLMLSWNNNNAVPLPENEILTVVNSVYQTHLAKTGTSDGRPNPDIIKPKNHHGFSFVSYGDLGKKTLIQPKNYWGEQLLFEQARLLIAGAPKIGKTNFNLELAIRLAIGGVMINWPTYGPCRVAYLNAEVVEYFMRERIALIADKLTNKEREMLNVNLAVTGRTNLDLLSNEAFYEVYDEVERFKPDIIIFDPLANLHSANEDRSTEMMHLVNRLDLLADINKSAVILVHHVRKNAAGGKRFDSFDAIRGSSALRGWADTNIMLYRADNFTMCDFEVRNGPSPDPMPVWFDRDVGRWREGTEEIPIMDEADALRLKRVQFVFNLLRNKPKGVTRDEVIDSLIKQGRISERTARRIFDEVKDAPGTMIFYYGKQKAIRLRDITGGDNYED